MKTYITGASGFIGSALVRELLEAGHSVTGLARSDAAAAALERAGATVHRGDLADPASVVDGIGDADAVAHLAFNHDDMSSIHDNGRADLAVVQALGDALAGSGRGLVTTSGTAVGAGAPGPLTEDHAVDTSTFAGAARGPSEELTLALADRGVRSALVRLSPSVHGRGDGHGFVPTLVRVARERGVSAHVGDGRNVWPAVHRLDAARLYRLALESAPAGTRWHGVAEGGVATGDIAAAIGEALGLPTTSIDPADAMDHFGWLGGFAVVDNPASSERTRELLGWSPSGPTLLEDIAAGVYTEAAVAGQVAGQV
ncbi:SDR family oxidoreductase [Nocardioides litoris]|uniref:SDR family oxidoreductase n=1 Tax=Nocardioides litoris TaxID=1926648 RepID=UPI0011244FF2|nr:SDR family oxidoreductase [Nocardioides litoris]